MYEKKKTLCDLFPGITKLLVDIRTIFNKIINAIKNKSRSHIIFSTVYTIFIFAVSTLICHNSNILVLALICLNVIISSFVISIEIASISSSIFWYYKIKYLIGSSLYFILLIFKIRNLNYMAEGHMTLNHIYYILFFYFPHVFYSFLRWLKNQGNPLVHKNAPWALHIIDFFAFFSPVFLTKKVDKSKYVAPVRTVIITIITLFLAFLFLALVIILKLYFPTMTIETIAFTIAFANNSINPKIKFIIVMFGISVILLTVFKSMYFVQRCQNKTITLISIDKKKILSREGGNDKNIAWPAYVLLILSFVLLFIQCDVISFISHKLTYDHLYENYYVNPDEVDISFPREKKNLIYIYLESYENTFTTIENGGNQKVDYMPELVELASKNINFSNTYGLGGQSVFYPNIAYTMGSTVAQTGGIPLTTPLGMMRNEMFALNEFLPSLIRLEDILNENGYNQLFIRGEDTRFAGYNRYVSRYDKCEIFDVNTALAKNYITPEEKTAWGFQDKKLFLFAKDLITDIAGKNDPFCVTLYTVDTHSSESGYRCELCDSGITDQLTAAIRCSSKQVADFIKWLSEQEYYKNTVIILVGDHLVENTTDYLNFNEDNYKRTTFNCIINTDKIPKREKNRIFSATDMFPTTLSAIGCTIKGDRLGLGTDLFSERDTLCEEFGTEKYIHVIQANSKYYNELFWNKDKIRN